MPENNNLNESNETTPAQEQSKPAQGNGIVGIGCILIFIAIFAWGMYKGAINRDEAKKQLAAKNIQISDSSVIDAVKKGDVETLKQLMLAGANPEAKGENDSSALILAATENKTEMVKAILSRTEKVNYKNAAGVSALIAAAAANNTEIVKMLLEKKADVNSRDNSGTTPLMIAAELANIEILKLLMDKGADVSLKNNKGETAMTLAKADNIKEALKSPSKPTAGAQGGTVPTELVKPVDIEKLSPAEARKTLDGLKIPYNDNRFVEAASKNETEAVALFIKAGLHPNTKNIEGVNTLMTASIAGNNDMIKFLVSKNANVNARDKSERTALMMAAENSKLDTVKLLLSLGADAKAKDKKGKTALDFASNAEIKKAVSEAMAK